jgi:uncharacterized membrane protein
VHDLRSRATRQRRGVIYLVLLLAGVVVGLVNALVHARDGWAAMPLGLALSALVLLLVAAASVSGLSGLRGRNP